MNSGLKGEVSRRRYPRDSQVKRQFFCQRLDGLYNIHHHHGGGDRAALAFTIHQFMGGHYSRRTEWRRALSITFIPLSDSQHCHQQNNISQPNPFSDPSSLRSGLSTYPSILFHSLLILHSHKTSVPNTLPLIHIVPSNTLEKFTSPTHANISMTEHNANFTHSLTHSLGLPRPTLPPEFKPTNRCLAKKAQL